MKEYFIKNPDSKLALISNGIEYVITFAVIGGIEYFYQYPTIEEIEKGSTLPKKRLVSEITHFLPE